MRPDQRPGGPAHDRREVELRQPTQTSFQLEPAGAYEGRGDGEEVIRLPFVAAVKASAAREPGHGPFHDPAVPAQSLRRLDALAGEAVPDARGRQPAPQVHRAADHRCIGHRSPGARPRCSRPTRLYGGERQCLLVRAAEPSTLDPRPDRLDTRSPTTTVPTPENTVAPKPRSENGTLPDTCS